MVLTTSAIIPLAAIVLFVPSARNNTQIASNSSTGSICRSVQFYIDSATKNTTANKRTSDVDEYLHSLLDFCEAKTIQNGSANLQAVVIDWLKIINITRMQDLWDQVSGSEWLHRLRQTSDTNPTWPQMPSFWQPPCTDPFCLKAVARLISRMLAFYYHNHQILAFNSHGENHHLDSPLYDQQDFLEHSVLCPARVGQCCLNYVTSVGLDQGLPVRKHSIATNAFFNISDADYMRQYQMAGVADRCFADIELHQQLDKVYDEICDVWFLTKEAKLNVSLSSSEEHACLSQQLLILQVRYRLLYSQVGLMDVSDFLASSYGSFCENIICVEDATFNTTETRNNTNTIFRQNQEIGPFVAIMKPLIIVCQSLVLCLNLLLLVAIHKSSESEQKLWPPVKVFLQNMCCGNLLIAISELASVSATYAIQSRPECLWSETVDYSTKTVDFNADFYCCSPISDMRPALFFGAMAACLLPFHRHLNTVLLTIRTICQQAMLGNFVAFSIFQAIPLLWPFGYKPWLKQPRRAVLAVWAISFIVAAATCVPAVLEYNELSKDLATRKELNMYVSMGFFSAVVERQQTNILQSTVIDLVLSVGLICAGELAHSLIAASVCYMSSNNVAKQIGGPQVTACVAQSLRSLVTTCIAMALWIASRIPLLVLSLLVYLDSRNIAALNNFAIYGPRTMEKYLKIFYSARVCLAMEPLVTPFLVILRYGPIRHCALRWLRMETKLRRVSTEIEVIPKDTPTIKRCLHEDRLGSANDVSYEETTRF